MFIEKLSLESTFKTKPAQAGFSFGQKMQFVNLPIENYYFSVLD
ncbi:hypothetical protein KIS4809_0815 [Bacillus sp. ZZV12-4809]|nr:hypothetical protein KIS4809_0815 [Bacillus sp. ZZV12-4809]